MYTKPQSAQNKEIL